jgi:hypothetical protein
MLCFLSILLSLHLFADVDVPLLLRMTGGSGPAGLFPVEIMVSPVLLPAPEAQEGQRAPDSPQMDFRLAIIRYVSGELARAVRPLPGGKQGFLMKVGQPLNQAQLERAVASHGAAINPGDTAQITHIEFRDHEIIVEVNGGGWKKGHWYQHLSIETTGGIAPARDTTTEPASEAGGPPGIRPGAGSTIFLDFGRAVPHLDPDELKKLLSPLLDFSKQHSASVQWIDTLPPEFQKAIKERHAAVGMDREMVVAAMGRPDKKVRERDPDGNEIEDWVYGEPPSRTVFVRFQGDRVTSIKEFP